MRRIITILIFVVAVFAISIPTRAAPYLYTFEGNVTAINTDAGGLIADAGLVVGSPVTYSVIIDLDADGYLISNSIGHSPRVDTATFDYFYTDYSGGSLFPGSTLFEGANVLEYHYGMNYLNANQGSVWVGSTNSRLNIYDLQDVTDWAVGETTFDAINDGYNDANQWSKLTVLNMTLTSKTLVPIPGAAWLFGPGLIGLMGFRKKLKKG
jgi:hypothetical protein